MGKVEVNIAIDTKPENVIKAFIDSKMLRDWWNVEKSLIEKKKAEFILLHGIYQTKGSVMFQRELLKNIIHLTN
ncbi:hypothetical protein [Aquimarina sp. 2201CG14-23]|uniref:hypothetical protein n=1 Tax=Aquimarina mycalae TaxID=3040073 RepID=UPI00247825DB|nr:hypothetical protein [Aquimarina sp. 2201CG14-23]MDH7448422.1 hypothetical protein [Aquimarina sp. 2201CG14-23]